MASLSPGEHGEHRPPLGGVLVNSGVGLETTRALAETGATGVTFSA